MKLRKAQIEALSRAVMKGFEDRMAAHLERFFPDDHALLGDVGVRAEIRRGIERAKRYGIVCERCVCKFLDVLFAFGRGFDTSVAFPWAAAILTDRRIADELLRAERLFQAAEAHIAQAPPPSVKWRRESP